MITKIRRKQQSYGIGYTHYGSQNHLMTSTWPCLEVHLKRQKRRTHNKSGSFFQPNWSQKRLRSNSYPNDCFVTFKLKGNRWQTHQTDWQGLSWLIESTAAKCHDNVDGQSLQISWWKLAKVSSAHRNQLHTRNKPALNKKPHAKHRSCGLHFRYTVIVRDSILVECLAAYGVHTIFKTIDLQCIVLGWNETWTVLGRKRL